ncbi:MULTISPECIES: ankyrin repeat domain-containing protein [unclassified Streptomyces]|uniref:ankyrin repeat domain-containing protein n=1 Tax=unclassified Streptomyces TaxID=2593676 RepID=UPI0036904D66
MAMTERLAQAAADGDAASVAELLRAGAEVDAAGHDGRTALDVAAHAGHAEAVRVLLAAGADPGQRAGEYGESTPLGLAAMYGHTGVVRALLDAGAPTGAQGRLGQVPLVLAVTAVEEGRPETVRVLLDRGADIDARMKDRTPLEWAAAFGQVDMVRELLAHGARATPKALSEARAGAARSPSTAERYALVTDALLAAGADVDSPPSGLAEHDPARARAEAGAARPSPGTA